MTEAKRPLKVFLCHAYIIPLWDADRDAVKALDGRVGRSPYRDHTRLATLAPGANAGEDGVDENLFVPHSFLENE